jgi:hypothetical protein
MKNQPADGRRFRSTANIFQRGDSFGNRHLVSVPAFSTVDKDGLLKSPPKTYLQNVIKKCYLNHHLIQLMNY